MTSTAASTIIRSPTSRRHRETLAHTTTERKVNLIPGGFINAPETP
jgi:hypothetical protein